MTKKGSSGPRKRANQPKKTKSFRLPVTAKTTTERFLAKTFGRPVAQTIQEWTSQNRCHCSFRLDKHQNPAFSIQIKQKDRQPATLYLVKIAPDNAVELSRIKANQKPEPVRHVSLHGFMGELFRVINHPHLKARIPLQDNDASLRWNLFCKSAETALRLAETDVLREFEPQEFKRRFNP